MGDVIDMRPQADDITLCIKSTCPNKCKRYYEYWRPEKYYQSYVNPSNAGECEIRIPWRE